MEPLAVSGVTWYRPAYRRRDQQAVMEPLVVGGMVGCDHQRPWPADHTVMEPARCERVDGLWIDNAVWWTEPQWSRSS